MATIVINAADTIRTGTAHTFVDAQAGSAYVDESATTSSSTLLVYGGPNADTVTGGQGAAIISTQRWGRRFPWRHRRP
jgi:hypothetical protein